MWQMKSMADQGHW